jgi:hypothetical protein
LGFTRREADRIIDMHRRKFTQGLALMAGGVLVHSVKGASSVQVAAQLLQSPPSLSRDFFSARIGQRFDVSDDRVCGVVLKAVERAARAPGREQFHVVFERKAGEPLSDGIFRLRGQDTAEFDLFLVSGEVGNGRQLLRATFNLLPLV